MRACVSVVSYRRRLLAIDKCPSSSPTLSHRVSNCTWQVVPPLLSIIHDAEMSLESQHDALLVLWRLSVDESLIDSLLDLGIAKKLPQARWG